MATESFLIFMIDCEPNCGFHNQYMSLLFWYLENLYLLTNSCRTIVCGPIYFFLMVVAMQTTTSYFFPAAQIWLSEFARNFIVRGNGWVDEQVDGYMKILSICHIFKNINQVPNLPMNLYLKNGLTVCL